MIAMYIVLGSTGLGKAPSTNISKLQNVTGFVKRDLIRAIINV